MTRADVGTNLDACGRTARGTEMTNRVKYNVHYERDMLSIAGYDRSGNAILRLTVYNDAEIQQLVKAILVALAAELGDDNAK